MRRESLKEEHMFGHMATLGFPVSTAQDFRHYAYAASEFGQRIVAQNGSYTQWVIGNGIELWVQVNRHGRILGMKPHFSGTARLRTWLTVRLPQSILDGAFYAWSHPLAHEALSDTIPFIFDLPDYDLYDTLELPTTTYIQLAAFAHSLCGFESDEAYSIAQQGSRKPGVESFFPAGLFTSRSRAPTSIQAEARVSGHVLATKMILNSVTGQKFYWAKIHTPCGELDVVADPQVVQGKIVKGGVIQGSFWLSGRLI